MLLTRDMRHTCREAEELTAKMSSGCQRGREVRSAVAVLSGALAGVEAVLRARGVERIEEGLVSDAGGEVV